ncbi:MAG: hypothetical protein HDR27_00040, partial [Lachnospiraceae bacterium]|nr:hypothetical protein [Lachnospiraceae bacterium]
DGSVIVTVTGEMTASDAGKGERFVIKYILSEDTFVIEAVCDEKESSLIIPVISREKEQAELEFSPIGGMLAVKHVYPMERAKTFHCRIWIEEIVSDRCGHLSVSVSCS